MLKKTLKITLLFFLVYSLLFKGIPYVTTGRISMILFSIHFFIFKFKPKKDLRFKRIEFVAIIAYFLIYLYAIYSYIQLGRLETTTISRFFYFVTTNIYMSFILVKYFDNKSEFIRAFSIISFIQACLIIVSFFSPSYRFFLASILEQTGNRELISDFRAPGLFNSAGATLSIIQGIGAFSSLYILLHSSKERLKKKNYIILMINIISIFFIGRTGIILFIILALGLFTGYKTLFLKKLLPQILIITLLVTFIAGISIRGNIQEDTVQRINENKEWFLEIFSTPIKQTAFYRNFVQKMDVPQLNYNTIIGTSKVRAEIRGHDSGYIQMYYSIGLVFAILFYLILLIHLLSMNFTLKKCSDNKFRRIGIFLIITLFFIEIKEPFLFKSSYLLYILVVLRLDYKEKKKEFTKNQIVINT
ncbi:hypothetical protein SAMN05446037_101015 [Anaerovirgula multivorans]|uniref:O-Antigen ligase n=1 Tax=Anaerovirgula multivorans TaxID=312168 RepID=A0A239EI60_9FIRM|nr:hypothetical protein [Anaerovirgula multivorans]SNS43574.1 hypothetical protein SAMN05446037_101015 [Anaerovirgula multivorans]